LNEINGDAEYYNDKDEFCFNLLAQKGENGAELGEARLSFLRCQARQND
jgi:hypothetical protein